MALTGTRMLEMRPSSSNLDKNMNRLSRYGAIDAHIIGNSEAESIISPQLDREARRSAGRAVKVAIYDYKDVTLGSTRSVTIADDDNTSAFYTVTWTTYTYGFTIVPTLFQNNEMDMQRDFDKKFRAFEEKLCVAIETQAIANLDAGKNQVWDNMIDSNKYTEASDVFTADYASREDILGDLSSLLRANDFYSSSYRVIGNPGVDSKLNKLIEHSKFNDQDKTLQVRDKTFHFTNVLPDAVGNVATGFIVPPGNLGYLVQHEREALVNRRTADGHEWGITTLPSLGIPLDYYSYEGVSDESTRLSEADMTRVFKEHHAFALTLATVRSHNTDLAVHASPITKFAISAT